MTVISSLGNYSFDYFNRQSINQSFVNGAVIQSYAALSQRLRGMVVISQTKAQTQESWDAKQTVEMMSQNV